MSQCRRTVSKPQADSRRVARLYSECYHSIEQSGTALERAGAQTKMKFAEFLESIPPNVEKQILDLCVHAPLGWGIAEPDLQLYCSSPSCEGTRFFRCVSGTNYFSGDKPLLGFLTYVCRNCEKTTKRYAVVAIQEGQTKLGRVLKFGEVPPFGPPVPSRVISLIGPDREMFLRGRTAENLGLGIGAFAYYRRVVENQKGRIIEEIGKVAQRVGAGNEVLKLFESAAKETQFSKAIEQVKSAIPQTLLIEGQNPLTLLHSALSEGLHAQTDEECLELAQHIRVVLTELADRISQALKDEAELKKAVSRLLSRKHPLSPGGTE